jgi:adenylate cyclase
MKRPNLERYAWAFTTFAPLLPNVLSSILNVWYNVTNIQPLLSPSQMTRFMTAVTIYNATIYPVLVFFYVRWMWSLRDSYKKLRAGDSVDPQRLEQDQRKVINSPWAIVVIGFIGWFLCIPVFLATLYTGAEPVHSHIAIHLPVSFLIAGMIAVAQSLFIAELCSLKLLHPAFFPNGGAADVKGGYSLTIARKGLIWAVSVVVCPVISLLLLIVAPQNVDWIISFALTVSLIAIVFGLASAWLMAQLITEPVSQLRQAAQCVAKGDLDVEVNLSRADDFGPLIDEFNRMVTGLNEKKYLQETFGRHVGAVAAKEILSKESSQTGDERVITVMFADLRNFTVLGSRLQPQQVVRILNLFLTDMVEIIERHEGMVNKFLGDGLMALFGASGESQTHATNALAAAKEMASAIEAINNNPVLIDQHVSLEIGIGIHTGQAVVGSIGSPKRLEYTAIGDTVNVASRIESLTKPLCAPILISRSTLDTIEENVDASEFPPQLVKGKSQPIEVFAPK